MSHALATVRHDGRRPSVTPGTRWEKTTSREAATDNRKMMAAAHAAAAICRPSRAPEFGSAHDLGLAPQAINLSRLRRSIVCRILIILPQESPEFLIQESSWPLPVDHFSPGVRVTLR
jgi:hypothetical protein